MSNTLEYDKLLSLKAHKYATKEYCRAIGLNSRETEEGDIVCFPDNRDRCIINNIPAAPFKQDIDARGMRIATQYCGSIGQQPFKIADGSYACSDSKLKITPIDLNYANGVINYTTGAGYVFDSNYREWTRDANSGKDVCVTTLPVIRDYCATFKDRRGNQTIGYFQGNLKCNLTGGYCEPVNEDDGNVPSCTITPAYCDAFSASYSTQPNGAGSCYLPDGQKFAESAIGTSIVRVYRDNIDQAIRACSSKDAAKCFVSTMQVLVAPSYIVSDMLKQQYADTMKSINDAVDQLYNNPTPVNLANLARVAYDSLPWMYWSKKLFSAVGGLIDGLVGMIPGLNEIVPSGFFSKMVTFGFNAVNPFFWISAGMTWGPKIWDYIVNFNLNDLKHIMNSLLKFGGEVLKVVNKLWEFASGAWLIRKILPSFISGPVIFFLNILSVSGLMALNSLANGGFVYKLFSGDYNSNIRNFFTNQVGQTFFVNWIYKGALLKIFSGLQAAYSWFVGLFS